MGGPASDVGQACVATPRRWPRKAPGHKDVAKEPADPSNMLFLCCCIALAWLLFLRGAPKSKSDCRGHLYDYAVTPMWFSGLYPRISASNTKSTRSLGNSQDHSISSGPRFRCWMSQLAGSLTSRPHSLIAGPQRPRNSMLPYS